jgi:anhydro-N-acetylmuramic acid kinase
LTTVRVLGLTSGSSLDGIDVALAAVRVHGPTVELEPLAHKRIPYSAGLREALLAVRAPVPCTLEELNRLDTEVGHALAAAAEPDADLVALLGPGVHRRVDGGAASTLRLGQPGLVAERTGRPVVAVPDAPDLADRLWLSGVDEPTAALNLGGLAGVTVVRPGGSTVRLDAGPANVLLDAAARMVSDGVWPRDVDGELAAQGAVREDLLDALLADAYYVKPAPKVTGSGHFTAGYLRAAVAGVPHVPVVDLLATLVELTAVTIADACRAHGVARVVASGGGTRNPVLMAALRRRLDPVPLVTSDVLGLPPEAKDAYTAALLGFLTWQGALRRPVGGTGLRVLLAAPMAAAP